MNSGFNKPNGSGFNPTPSTLANILNKSEKDPSGPGSAATPGAGAGANSAGAANTAIHNAGTGNAGSGIPGNPVARPKKSASRRGSKAKPKDDVPLISTSSPEGIAAAAQITPARIAHILLAEGPLPIRHLTAQLITQVPAFGHLSLSKQRRLIMAALEAGDPVMNCVFDKIGWGQWEAHVVTPTEFAAHKAAIHAANAANGANSSGQTSRASGARAGGARSRPRHRSSGKIGSSSVSAPLRRRRRRTSRGDHNSTSPGSGSAGPLSASAPTARTLSASFRRESITNPQTDAHNLKVPGSPSLQPLQSLRRSYRARKLSMDEAVESSSDEEDGALVMQGSSPESGDGGVFSFENGDGSGVLQPRKFSLRSRSTSGSTSGRPSFGGVAKPRKPRSSFSSHTIEAALDESGIESSRMPFSNPSSVSRQSFLRTSVNGARAGQAHARAIAGSAGSNGNASAGAHPKEEDSGSFTDEEDWEAIGATSLREGEHHAQAQAPAKKTKEMSAAMALMDLRSDN